MTEVVKRHGLQGYATVVIHVGTNNLQRGTLAQIKLDFLELFNLLATLVVPGNTHVVISCILPRLTEPDFSDLIGEVNGFLEVEAESREFLTIFDGGAALRDVSGAVDRSLLCPDGLHLMDKGKRLVVHRLGAALQELHS